jgi:serralysin
LSTRMLGAGDAFTYTLLDDAGHRFTIQGDRLVVAQGAKLDYEQQASHTITVRATSTDGRTLDQTFTIALEDVADETNVVRPTTDSTGTGIFTGTDGNDTLIGTLGQDKLFGGLGNDLIYGKRGHDTLNGGDGRDIFMFDTTPNARMNVDRIQDFDTKDDAIYLDDAVFKALGKKGTLAKPAQLQAKMFWKGTKAHDGNDRLIYNPKTGALLFDADGNSSGAAVKIAMLSKSLKAISYKDFFII